MWCSANHEEKSRPSFQTSLHLHLPSGTLLSSYKLGKERSLVSWWIWFLVSAFEIPSLKGAVLSYLLEIFICYANLSFIPWGTGIEQLFYLPFLLTD